MNTSKITSMITITLILLSATTLALRTVPAKAVQSSASGPVLYVSPDTQTTTVATPLTTHPRWNFSIYASNMTNAQIISVDLNSSDPTKAKVVNWYAGSGLPGGWAFDPSQYTSFDDSTGELIGLFVFTVGSTTITSPVEIFKIEVEVEDFAPSVAINIENCTVLDSSPVPIVLLVGPQNSHTILMTAISTNTITFAGQHYNVTTTSNSTVSTMTFDQPGKGLNFTTSVPDGTNGFVNATIPKALLNASLTDWQVLIDNSVASPVISENATHSFIYLNYSQGAHEIRIIGTWVVPEFPSTTILLTLLATLAISLALIRKIHKKRWQTL